MAYDGSGDLTEVNTPDGNVTSLVYDNSGDVTRMDNTDQELMVSNTYDSEGHLLESAGSGSGHVLRL